MTEVTQRGDTRIMPASCFSIYGDDAIKFQTDQVARSVWAE